MKNQSEVINKLEKELADLKDKVQIAVSVAKLGFWEYDYETKEIMLSREASEITGLEKSKNLLVSDVLNKIFDEHKVNLLKKNLELIIDKKEEINFTFSFTRPSDYENITVKIIAKPIANDNKMVVKLMGIVQNITAQKISEEQLKSAKERAEDADQLKSAFLANMSHEIRTPLNAILGFSRLLINKETSDIQKHEYSKYITNSANNLLNLIRDIIDVSKIEAGKIDIEKDICYVNKILNELKIAFEKESESKNKNEVKLVLKMADADMNLAIFTDPFRFNQVFINLLGNALKFTETGSIEFGYTKPGKDYLQFYVKDTGIGIPLDKRELIFSRFGQIVNKKIKNPGGTGLGLSITQHLVEKLGGKIWYESELNVGTTFSFTLPVDNVNLNNEQKRLFLEESYEEIENELCILAVEDDELNMILLIDTLSVFSDKIKIDKAKNGREALAKIKEKDYDLIIMDVRMPELDGYETTKYIREKFAKPKCDIPILGLSAHAIKTEIDEGKLVGMNEFLSKPINPKKLIEKIQKLTHIKTLEVTDNEGVIDETEREQTTVLDLSFFENLFKNDRSKINKTLLAYSKEIPLQLESLKSSLKNKQFENLKLTAHSMKSTFKYIGRGDLSETAKQIEQMSQSSGNNHLLNQYIDFLISNWKLLDLEIKKLL